MNYITTTDLRTKTPELITILKNNGEVSLIHRSKVIGIIQPASAKSKPFDPEAFEKFAKKIRPKRILSDREKEKVYRRHLEEKYGKGLS